MGGAERDNLSRHIMNEYQPEKASGILGAMFPNMTADRQDRIALALSGLSMNPNLALQSAVRDRMQERSERRKDWMSERKDYNQRNVTIDALRDAGVSENDLQMARANPDYMRALLSQVAQNRMGKAKTPTPYSEQAKIMSDLRNGLITKEQANAALTGGGDSTEADREIDRLESIGIPRDVAIRIKEGVYKTSVDPVTREVTVIDLSSGQPVYKTDEAAPTAPMTTEPAPAQSGPDASDAFGLEGTIKGGINSVSDFVGMGVPFEGVKETQSDFAVLRENLVNDITQGYGQRVPSWLMQNIQNLTPKTGAFSGPEDAQSKLGALERSFQQELTTIRQQLGGPISPQQRQVLTYREAALNAAIGKVTGALGRFGADNGGNKTSSGVTWRIEQ
ncbi:hypothetical protein J3456_19330, partial [Sulfitobacter sp. NFXS29]|uniref:hypothetical protein n=1 Tax=Sulfitobacter sp. NFXS29 TaxID=2818438 RepID=UPI0032E027B7